MLMKTGRPPKPGPRYPGGQIKREPPISPEEAKRVRIAVANGMPHRIEVKNKDLRTDPMAESNLGRLFLNGQITQPEYAAGRWYAGVVNRYRVMLGSFSVGSNAGALIAAGGPAWIDDHEAVRRTIVYNLAVTVLFDINQKAARAVSRVAVYDEYPPNELWGYLRLGLLALAVHRGFTTEPKVVALKKKLWYSINRR